MNRKWTTPGGKDIELEYAKNTSLIKIRFVGGGELPEELSGLYTEESSAEKAIIAYLDKAQTKAKKVA